MAIAREAPPSPSKLNARILFTGIQPVSSEERDARWPSNFDRQKGAEAAKEKTAPARAFQSSTNRVHEQGPTYPVKPILKQAAYPQTPRSKVIADAKAGFLNPGAKPQRPVVAPDFNLALLKSVKLENGKMGSSNGTQVDNRETQTSKSNSEKSLNNPAADSLEIAKDKQQKSATLGPAYIRPLGSSRIDRVTAQFAELIDRMDVPQEVKQKMLQCDLQTKEGMLNKHDDAKSSTSSTKPILRKTRSFSFLRSNTAPEPEKANKSPPVGFEFVTRPQPPLSPSKLRAKFIAPAPTNKSTTQATPENWAMLLRTSNHLNLGAGCLVKLRMLLRHEHADWTMDFVRFQGYRGLLERLSELFALEWRQEQRDDTLLFELLKCFRDLLSSESGRQALASSSPEPFRSIMQNIYSDKKPGDLTCRQTMIQIVQGVFDIPLVPLLQPLPWNQPMRVETLPSRPTTSFQNEEKHNFVRLLMIGPPNEEEEAKVNFIRHAHKPRLFKRWVSELSSVLSDYFWIFCHSQNNFKQLETLNQDKMRAPVVPAGNSAGVEAIAMDCCVAHLRLLNSMCSSAPNDAAASEIHADLFDCAFDRCLLTLRKCNQQYYPQIHLELARYVDLALKSGYKLSPKIESHIEGRFTTTTLPTPKISKTHKRAATEAASTNFQF